MGAQCWQSNAGMLSLENQEKGKILAVQSNQEKADAVAKPICSKIKEIQQETGLQSYHEIAKELNLRGITTPSKSCQWAYSSVRNVMQRNGSLC